MWWYKVPYDDGSYFQTDKYWQAAHTCQACCDAHQVEVYDDDELDMVIPKSDVDQWRQCDVCGKVMQEGYCIDGGSEYFCTDKCLHEVYTEEEYLELYGDGENETYWTDWSE